MCAVQSEGWLGFSEPRLCEVWEAMEEGDCTGSTLLEVSGSIRGIVTSHSDEV